MSVSSMTGFARSERTSNGFSCQWEIRSVNGRGLDVRVRLPAGFDRLEAPVRTAVSAAFSRGSISATLTFQAQARAAALCLNEENLKIVLAAAHRLEELSGLAVNDSASLLNVRGVLETREPSDDSQVLETAQAVALESLAQALAELKAARQSEGGKLDVFLQDQVMQIERLSNAARASEARTPEAIQARLSGQLSRLMDTNDMQIKLDADRLYQEAVLLAKKADIAEELDRLDAHIASARELLGASGPVGRKLDFLVQEFNREANTLCSKANHIEITRLGLEMKTVIDQFREQVQNVE